MLAAHSACFAPLLGLLLQVGTPWPVLIKQSCISSLSLGTHPFSLWLLNVCQNLSLGDGHETQHVSLQYGGCTSSLEVIVQLPCSIVGRATENT